MPSVGVNVVVAYWHSITLFCEIFHFNAISCHCHKYYESDFVFYSSINFEFNKVYQLDLDDPYKVYLQTMTYVTSLKQ